MSCPSLSWNGVIWSVPHKVIWLKKKDNLCKAQGALVWHRVRADTRQPLRPWWAVPFWPILFRNSEALTYPPLSFSAWWSAQRPPSPPWYQTKGYFKGTVWGIQNKHWSTGKHFNGFLTKISVWFQLPKEANHWYIPIWVFSYTKFSLTCKFCSSLIA